MSQLSNFLKGLFSRDNVKAFLDLALKLLKMVLGGVANDLQTVAKQEVEKAEASGKTGLQKYEMAFNAIRARFPELKESAINLAIELFVQTLEQAKG